jgi:tripartite-type tricarboxylate transporter receptor subunit TctC
MNIPGLTVPPLLGKKVAYNLDDMTWIGNLAKSTYAIAVKADSPINSLKELCSLGRPAKFSDTGPTSTSSVTSQISMSLINCPITNVTGYKGSSGATVAVMRGEVDATLKPISSLRKYVKSGDMKFIVTFENKPSLKGVPSSRDLGHNEFEKLTLYRIVGAPPGLPSDIAKKLSDALYQAATSATVQEWSKKSKKPLEPLDSAEATKIMAELSGFYAKYKSILAN